uniref:uncharacterized protein LOC120342470 n=1 Tax=Styela clava TaxID=7725 RepID=UPI0019399E64|nr:uncharacterized protein LOC120342470 [Styela clava]
MDDYSSNVSQTRLESKRLRCSYSLDGSSKDNYIVCQPNEFCSSTWYQTKKPFETIVTRRDCFTPPAGTEDTACEQSECKSLIINWNDTNIACTRGPGAICCCNEDLCNIDVPGYDQGEGCYNSMSTTTITTKNDTIFISTTSPLYTIIALFIAICIIITVTAFLIKRIRQRTRPPQSTCTQKQEYSMRSSTVSTNTQPDEILTQVVHCIAGDDMDTTAEENEIIPPP